MTKAVYKGRKLGCTQLYVVDYSAYGFPEWNFMACEHDAKAWAEKCREQGWVVPDFIPIDTVEVKEE